MSFGPSSPGTARPGVTVAPRDLTPDELALLRSGIGQVRQLGSPLGAGTIDTAWKQLLDGGRSGGTAPARFVGVAIGTALLDLEPSAYWVACLGPNGWTPGVVSQARPDSPVLVVADTISRWHDGTRDWIPGYLIGAYEHLVHPAVGSVDDQPWYASPDDLPQPPDQSVRDLALTALDLGLTVAGDEANVFAVLPGPLSARCPENPEDRDRVYAWARGWAAESWSDRLAIAWVDPPHHAGRHAAARSGSVTVEASEAGCAGMVLAHEYVSTTDGPEPTGQPVVIGPVAPLL